MKNKIVFDLLLIEIALIILCSIVSILAHNDQVEKDRQVMQTKLDQFFQGKNLIFSGGITGVMGTLQGKTFYLSGGGFSIFRIEKQNNEYIYSKIISGDIFYNSDNYKPNPNNLYEEAFKYLLWGNYDNNSFGNTENSLNQMSTFGSNLETKFHGFGYEREKKLTGSYSLSSYSVSYTELRNYYSIYTKTSETTTDLIISIVIGIVVATGLTLFVFLILITFYPSINKENSLKNIKWKDIDSGTILLLEPKLFTTNKVTIIEKEKVKKGIAKFSEKGTQLHISLIDNVLFYKIIKLENNKLEVENLNSNKLIYFEKLDSKPPTGAGL